ncbi:flagellar M-ring protein FliF [Duganella sp. FT80W]|uniref:Flagellar M-ring protein n=1 Tax=Duganella guangzhouensis TaxID=2666084 RepID=A0A6I2L7K8_9BURK|nr:flagellar basal-body MS-ring/collar protein FliF [Duganella guangzhouensis]MRW94171.1 flagellar M-ring protein FliF [Duganella guangzhouensis]
MTETWQRMSLAARAGLVIGVLLIVALTAGLGIWAYRADYQILFSDVAPADAASMTAELDKMKTPYQLSDGGATILVPKELVYKTRLKLMGKELPLHGAVGFEVFNNADFGMTEFVQKVNFLRAIQGELTRTILAIDEVQAARVHLALPEQGLFKKAQTKPKASVTLTMKNGKELAPEQIAGIQRLVAASVPDIVSSDVTVLNQHGVALTRVAQGEAAEAALNQLDSKRSTEEYLLKKVNQVLDRTYGPGQAVATVDVALDLDQSKVTTEEVLPAKNPDPAAAATGVVVRERSSSSEASGAAAATGSARVNGAPNSNTSEFDYQVGRRVEQVVSGGGTVKRMSIAVLVKPSMDEEQLARLKEVVALAAGFNSQRGDAVVVYSMHAVANQVTAAAPLHADLVASGDGPADSAAVPREASGTRPAAAAYQVGWILAALATAVVLAATIFGLVARRRKPAVKRLSAAERAQMLDDVRQWIANGQQEAGGGRRS